MIIVNINVSGANAVTDDQIQDAAKGNWVISDRSVQIHADYLVAVRKNTVVGAWAIDRYDRTDGGKRVAFDLSPAPQLAHLLGEPSPEPWISGQANPVKLVDTSAVLPATGEPAPHKLRIDITVTLNGQPLTIQVG